MRYSRGIQAELAPKRILRMCNNVFERHRVRRGADQRPYVAVALVVYRRHHLALRVYGYVLDRRFSFWDLWKYKKFWRCKMTVVAIFHSINIQGIYILIKYSLINKKPYKILVYYLNSPTVHSDQSWGPTCVYCQSGHRPWSVSGPDEASLH